MAIIEWGGGSEFLELPFGAILGKIDYQGVRLMSVSRIDSLGLSSCQETTSIEASATNRESHLSKAAFSMGVASKRTYPKGIPPALIMNGGTLTVSPT